MKMIKIWAEGLLAVSCCSWAGEFCAPGMSLAHADRYDDLILVYSQRRGLNPKLVKAIVAVESDFSTRAVSNRGARGLMQVMPATAVEIGADADRLHDAETNIDAGTKYLSLLVRQARDANGLSAGTPLPRWLQRRVVAAYNGGPRNLARNEWAPETRAYVSRVMTLSRSRLASVHASDFRKS
jgi:soluble lytic murein transglycosylase-like protein